MNTKAIISGQAKTCLGLPQIPGADSPSQFSEGNTWISNLQQHEESDLFLISKPYSPRKQMQFLLSSMPLDPQVTPASFDHFLHNLILKPAPHSSPLPCSSTVFSQGTTDP